MTQNHNSIFDYIFGLTVPGVKLDLVRVHEFIQRLGNPFEAYPVIHIAGTNGKGSTASMIAAILNAHGYKTGLFTSPHLVKANERIRIGNALIPDAYIIRQVNKWKADIEALGITFFEVLTALAMSYFKDQKVDYAVLETGLGGRLDATNVVNPELSIITSISMDHENILGDTLEKITYEKAGIIKALRPVVVGHNPDSVIQQLEAICSERGSDFHSVQEEVSILNTRQLIEGQEAELRVNEHHLDLILPLMGVHQIENLAVALLALNQLNMELHPQKIQRGLDCMVWLGRLQILQNEPLVLYDVAHNQEGVQQLLLSLKARDMGHATLVAAFNARKNIPAMLDLLRPWEGLVFFTVFEGHSALSKDALLQEGIDPQHVFDSPRETYETLLADEDISPGPICFFGSHYLAESLFELFDLDMDYREEE